MPDKKFEKYPASLVSDPKTELGHGASYWAYKVTFNGVTLAIKVCRTSQLRSMYDKFVAGNTVNRTQYREYTAKQRAILEQIAANPHPNIHTQLGYGTHEYLPHPPYSPLDFTFWVSAYMPSGDLEKWLKSDAAAKATWDERVLKINTLAAGVTALHTVVKVIHGDIKPDNVLLHADGSCALADFDHASTIQKPGLSGGAPLWLAPELLFDETNRARVSTAADVYSACLVLLQIASLIKDLFPDIKKRDKLKTVVKAGQYPSFAADCPSHVAKAITLGFMAKPTERPPMSEVHEHLLDPEKSFR